MLTNTELLAVAKSQIGNGGEKYRKYAHGSGNYCNMFVFWLFDANGCGSLFSLPSRNYYRTYCPDSIKWCRQNLAEIPPYIAMSCDIIYFDWEPNGVPNHIGVVDHKISTSEIATVEGNTTAKINGKTVSGVVAAKTRNTKYTTIYRTHFKSKPNYKPLTIDGEMGYQTVAGLQKVVGASVDTVLGLQTVRSTQRWAGCAVDGCWQKGTSRAIQKKIGAKQDGEFGPESVRKLQKYINTALYTVKAPAATTTGAQKIVAKANELAWPYGTPSSKWDYKKGSPTAKCKKAMEKHGYKGKGKQSSCAYACNTIVRDSGVNTSFGSLHGYKKPFPKSEKGFNMIWSGKKIPEGKLEPGDVVRYKKKSKDEHVLIYMGNNRVCEARHYHRFMNIYKDEHRYNGSNVKISTIQVLRPKG